SEDAERPSQHLWGEGDDLHELLAAELTRDRSEDAGADRLELRVDEDGAVLVEADRAAVGTRGVVLDANDDRLRGVALLHLRARHRLLDGDDDDVTKACIATARAAEHLDALDTLGAGIVGDVQGCAHLDHDDLTPPRTSSRGAPR